MQRSDDFGVDYYAFANLQTGLGTSSRSFARALEAGGIPYHLESLRFICPEAELTDHGLSSDPRRFRVSFEHANADMTMKLQGRFGKVLEGYGYRIAMWYWELAAFRPDWVPCIAMYDEIWVASEFGRRAVQAMTRTPVNIVPPPVSAAQGDGVRGRRQWGVPEDVFVFLYVFDYSSYVDRKNPSCLIDAYEREFGDDPRFRLVLKVSYGRADDSGYARMVQRCAKLGTVLIIDEVLSQKGIDDVFAMADCYVSPHRSEGFGLTVAEQMLRRCPVIATDYGATTDFVTREVAYPLRYSLVELEEDQGPYQAGYVWADPSVDHLGAVMRHVVEHPEEVAAKAELAEAQIRARYDTRVRGEDLLSRLTVAHQKALVKGPGA
jgi:glycosyltransferase involved in cell wall biosynthesis